jgi:hypothetical protein
MAVTPARQTPSYEVAWEGLLCAVRRDYAAGVERTVDHMGLTAPWVRFGGKAIISA